MNKEEILNLIDTLAIDKTEFWILSSSSLVIRNLFDKANDLDIAVTEKGLRQLSKKYELISKGNNWYEVTDLVECVLDTKEDYKIEEYEGLQLLSLTEYYKHLKNLTREKDIIKRKIVEEQLRN